MENVGVPTTSHPEGLGREGQGFHHRHTGGEEEEKEGHQCIVYRSDVDCSK